MGTSSSPNVSLVAIREILDTFDFGGFGRGCRWSAMQPVPSPKKGGATSCFQSLGRGDPLPLCARNHTPYFDAPFLTYHIAPPSWLISDDHVHHRTKELMVLTFGFVKYKFLCQEHAETGTTPLRLANNKCASCRPHPNSAKRTPNEA